MTDGARLRHDSKTDFLWVKAAFVRKTVENRRVFEKTVDNNEKYPYKMLKEVLENVIKFIFLFYLLTEILSRRKELWTNFSKISEHGSTVKTEIMAGFTTFFAMAYIVFVNPNQVTGFTEGLDDIWNAVYVASILVATIGTLLMSLLRQKAFCSGLRNGTQLILLRSFVASQVITGGDAVQGYQAGLVIILLSGYHIYGACR